MNINTPIARQLHAILAQLKLFLHFVRAAHVDCTLIDTSFKYHGYVNDCCNCNIF